MVTPNSQTEYSTQQLDNLGRTNTSPPLVRRVMSGVSPSGDIYDLSFGAEGFSFVKDLFFFHDVDEGVTYTYIGKVSRAGTWLIMRVNAAETQALYAWGASDYETGWTNRASLTYRTVDLAV